MIKENFKESDYSDWLRERLDVIALNVRGDREVAMDAETTMSEKALAEALGVRYTPMVMIFLSQANEPVARVNRYRNMPEFKQVLDYVDAQAYQSQTLAEYLDAQKAETAAAAGAYTFREHALIREAIDVGNLSAVDGPLLLLFEDTACVACDALHDGHREHALPLPLHRAAGVRGPRSIPRLPGRALRLHQRQDRAADGRRRGCVDFG